MEGLIVGAVGLYLVGLIISAYIVGATGFRRSNAFWELGVIFWPVMVPVLALTGACLLLGAVASLGERQQETRPYDKAEVRRRLCEGVERARQHRETGGGGRTSPA